MSQYFDKNFFKFLIGFISIILISLAIIAFARFYESREKIHPDPIDNVAKTQP